jgi:sialidase-1
MTDRPAFPYERRPDLVYSVVQGSSPGNPRNDTASVAHLGSGDLMVVWHKYRATGRGTSDFGRSDIACKVSRDGGRTWGSERILVEADPADNNVQAPALRRLRNGDLLLICLRGHAGGESSTMLLLRSTDDGRTFHLRGTVWDRSPGQWLQGGASSLLELRSGRLLIPYHGGTGHQGSQHNVARCAYSDDGGRTWRHSEGTIDLPMRGAMEASVAELPDGELVMSLRTQLGAVFLSRSLDEGETWSLPQTTGLAAPESCTCLRCPPGTADLLLLWNDSLYDPTHHHYGLRTPLSLALSTDRGRAWRKIADLARQEGYNFTNLSCDFIDGRRAVITYCVWGPDRISDDGSVSWHNPEVFDLHTLFLDVDWVYAQGR